MSELVDTADQRPVWLAMMRGLKRRCPACGEGHCMRGYLKPKDCEVCGAEFAQIRADDLPPYITIFLVGHIVVPFALMAEKAASPPLWLQMTIWPAVTLLLTLAMLPYVKGAALGLFWALRLRGDERQ